MRVNVKRAASAMFALPTGVTAERAWEGRPVNRVRVHALALVMGVTALVAACGGSAATKAPAAATTSGGTPPSAAVSQPSAAPSVAPASVAPVAASAAPLPSVGDLSNSASALSSVNSYTVSITTTGGSNPGSETIVVVRKPALAESITATTAGKTTRIVVVGSAVWIDEGTGTFTKTAMPAAALSAMTSAFDPGTFVHRANSSVALSALQTVGVETKNGVPALHLRADHSTAVPAGQPTIAPGATIDLWVATDGNYLVALEMNGLVSSTSTNPSSVMLEVTNINDPSLSVSAPS